jgi:hypothetical protein
MLESWGEKEHTSAYIGLLKSPTNSLEENRDGKLIIIFRAGS